MNRQEDVAARGGGALGPSVLFAFLSWLATCGGCSGSGDTPVGGSAAGTLNAGLVASPETAGTMEVRLYPTEAVTPGRPVLVTFGVPFPRGSISAAELMRVRVLRAGSEVPVHVSLLTPWRHARSPALDGTSVRVARVQFEHTFSEPASGLETLVVEWGRATRLRDVAAFRDPRDGWHTVSSGTFAASDGVSEPDVYAILPPEQMVMGIFRPGQAQVLDPAVGESRASPSDLAATAQWPGFREQDQAAVDNFYTITNQDDPRVAAQSLCPYKTAAEPWLYDRAAAMFVLYFRSGFPSVLREAVRAAEFYRTRLGTGGADAGLFRLAGEDSKYSYNESLAYLHWLTADEAVIPAITRVASAHDRYSPDVRWSPGRGFWTERAVAFSFLSGLVAWEVTGDTAQRDRMLERASDLIWHQDGAGGQIPVGGVDGGLYHYGRQHLDGSEDQLLASPWMTVLVVDAMVRAQAFTDDPAAAGFIARAGTFLRAGCKRDTGHPYDTGPLLYPDYMTRRDGASDERDGLEAEHAIDVASAVAWAAHFTDARGGDGDSLRTLARDLYITYDYSVNHWIRPGGPAAGLPAFRVSPWRKYAWEHRPSGSLSWLLRGK